ncbi:MAG: hypothetical protein ACYDEB_06890 [Dehalococcoidia bacterium]
MSTSSARLDRLYPALSPKERAILVLRAWKEGREPNHRLLRSRSDRDAVEYNRIIDLLQAATGDLTQYLVIVHLLVGQLEVKFSWFLTILAWANSVRKVNRAEELAEVVRRALVEGIARRWRELRSLDIVLEEIAAEVDGEDVLHPEARELLERTRAQLRALPEAVTGYGGTCELAEPDAAEIEALREHINGRAH